MYPKTGILRRKTNMKPMISVMIVQTGSMLHNDNLIDRIPIHNTYASKVDLPMHLLLNFGLILSSCIKFYHDDTILKKITNDTLNSSILYAYLISFFLWLILRVSMTIVFSSHLKARDERMTAFFAERDGMRAKAIADYAEAEKQKKEDEVKAGVGGGI